MKERENKLEKKRKLKIMSKYFDYPVIRLDSDLISGVYYRYRPK